MAEVSSPTIITWNVSNWITVSLMVFVFFSLLGLGAKLWQQRKAA